MPRTNKYATIKDITKLVRKKLKCDEDLARKVIDMFFVEIRTELLNGKSIRLNDFGSFEIIDWKSKEIYDINQGKKIERDIRTLSFKPSENIRKEILD